MADAAQDNGARQVAPPAQRGETPAAMSPVTSDPLGLVAGTVPATPLRYSVSLAPGQYAQLDDVVVTQRGLPGRDGIQIAGVVTNVEAMHEGARFASDVFLIEQGALPAEICEVAEVTVTRVEPELFLVAALSARWDWYPTQEPAGKVIWCELEAGMPEPSKT